MPDVFDTDAALGHALDRMHAKDEWFTRHNPAASGLL